LRDTVEAMTELRRYDDDKALALMDGAATVNRIVRGATAEELAERRFGDWSAVDLIAHLTDTAEVFAERVRRAVEEDTPHVEVIPAGRQLDVRDPLELAKRLLRAHQRIVAYLRSPGAAQRALVHGEWGRVDAGHVAAYQADHTTEHVTELAAAFPPTR
jgi:hypothetical protein